MFHRPKTRRSATGEAGLAASQVAALPDVRAVLLAFQRDFAACPPNGKLGAVLDGRDIGTVVCPDAQQTILDGIRGRACDAAV